MKPAPARPLHPVVLLLLAAALVLTVLVATPALIGRAEVAATGQGDRGRGSATEPGDPATGSATEPRDDALGTATEPSRAQIPATDRSRVAPTSPSSGSTTDGVRSPGLAPAGYEGRYRAVGRVVEAPGDVARICFGAVAAVTGPPSCGGGTVVVGWDWGAVPAGSVSREAGVRSGAYAVIGTYDGTRLTMTDPAVPSRDGRGQPPVRSAASLCPVPPGGWPPSEPDLATQQSKAQAALQVAALVEGYTAFALLDTPGPGDPTAEELSRAVLVVTTTGDLAQMEEQVRTAWDGALCVIPAPRTAAELQRVQLEVGFPPGHLSSGVDQIRGVLELEVEHAMQPAQDAYDAAYGPGVIELRSRLTPVD